jgi:hypothetical protein
VTATELAEAEPYESYQVGDEVWCLAWVGMPFTVTGKSDETRTIEIDGAGPCSLPEGALLDLDPQNHFMLTHQKWDSIWYWPDIAGERYQQVVDRFVNGHREGEIVTGYVAGGVTVVENPSAAMSFRLSFAGYGRFGNIRATPVVAIGDDGSLVHAYDPAIGDERWLPSGPAIALELKMIAYRWALAFGKIVLNWQDYD